MTDPGSIQILIKTIYDATGIRMSESDLQKFVQSGKSVQGAATAIGTAAQAAKTNMDSLAGSLGVGAGVAAMMGLAKSEAATAMETQRLSLVLGLSVAETSRWAYATKMATGSSEGLSMAAFHASHALEEIRAGTGAAAEAIHAMGIDPAGIKGIPDLLLKLGDFIQTSTLPQEQKLALAHEILGRSAREMYPLLAKGGEGIKALASQADAASAVITDKMVDSSRKFTLELDKLHTQLKKGIGLPIIEFAAAHPELVKLALEVVVLGQAFKTLESVGVIPVLVKLGTALATLTVTTTTETAAELANTVAKAENTAARMAQTAQIPVHVLATQGETGAVINLTKAEVAEALAANGATMATTRLAAARTALNSIPLGVAAVGAVMGVQGLKSFADALEGNYAESLKLASSRARLADALKTHGRQKPISETPVAPGAVVAPPANPPGPSEPEQLAADEAALTRFKAGADLRKEQGENTLDTKRAAVEDAPNYAARKQAEADLRAFEKKLHAERLADIQQENLLREQVAVRKYNESMTAAVAADRAVGTAASPAAKAEAQSAADEAHAKAIAASAELDAVRIEGQKNLGVEQKRITDEQAKQAKQDAAESKKDRLDALEAIAKDEKRKLTERVQAIRDEYALKEQLAGPGERAKLELEKSQAIAGLEKHNERRMPDVHADRLAQVGGFVGTSAATFSPAQRTNDLLERILREGIPVTNHPPGKDTRD